MEADALGDGDEGLLFNHLPTSSRGSGEGAYQREGVIVRLSDSQRWAGAEALRFAAKWLCS